MKKPLKNVAASVHDRLLNKAKTEERPFNELLQYFAMERFLYRLSRSRQHKILESLAHTHMNVESFTCVLSY